MRWIDIILPEPGTHHLYDRFVAEARTAGVTLAEVQTRDGLDAPTVVKAMQDIGNKLFQAIGSTDSGAFDADRSRPGSSVPDLGLDEHDDLMGFHLVAAYDHLDLPWTWLHNGIEFLLEKHPICVSDRPADPPTGDQLRPWMQRQIRAGFLIGADGSNALRGILKQLRPDSVAAPELLFVPGHSEQKIRRLIYREAEAIELALGAASLGEALARLHLPQSALTPRELSGQGWVYQGIHFAGPTSQPARVDDAEGEYWMNRLVEEAAAPSDHQIAEAAGMEGEVVGIDPVTALLDAVSEKYDREGPPLDAAVAGSGQGDAVAAAGSGSRHSRDRSGDSGSSAHGWLLPDGPVDPASLNRGGGVPPLVFSNSFCALPNMGDRFLAAGASTFIGPMLPLFSRPARIFTGYAYDALGDGWCAGAAIWKAARECRRELGKEHPAWLSYGVQGYGSLALQYL